MPRSLLVIIPFIVCSCLAIRKQGELGTYPNRMHATEYVHWVNDANYPFRDTQTVSGVLFILEYQPVEAELARMLCRKQLTPSEARESLESVPDILSFELTIRVPKAGTDLYTYAPISGSSTVDRATFFAFEFKQSLKLVEGPDTLNPSMFIHERGIPGNPSSTFSFSYDRSRTFKAQELLIVHPFEADTLIRFPLGSWSRARLPELNLSDNQ